MRLPKERRPTVVTRVLVVLLTLAALVTPWFVTGDPLALEAASSFSIDRPSASPEPVAPGQQARLAVTVQARGGGLATVIHAVGDAQGREVWRQTWADQLFARQESRTFAADWTAPLASGEYTLTVRAVDAAGKDLAKPRSTSLTVSGSEAISTATATPTLAPPTSTPTPTPVPPTATPSPTATPTGDDYGEELDAEEARLLELINGYRQTNGLAPLAVHPTLQASATWMSHDMAANDYFDHVDSLGRGPVARIYDFGYDTAFYIGEDIAADFPTAQQVFDAWKMSPVHNSVLLEGRFQTIGIARAYGATSTYGWYWTADFVGE
jgi:uncharacterized protein YkwD